MDVIRAWRGRSSKDHGPALRVKCPNCGTSCYFRFETKTTWRKLFGMPIRRRDQRHFLWCQVCAHRIELKGNDVEHARQLSLVTSRYLSEGLSESEYEEALRSHRLEGVEAGGAKT